jgi:hypothetical protein
MNTFRGRLPSGVLAATLCSATVGAQFVAGTSARESVFLSHFDATALPLMMVGASLLSIILVVIGGAAFRKISPSIHVPATYAASAALLVAEWALIRVAPGPVTRIFYLHAVGLGPILGSGFWLVASERFDPRTAKKHFGQIAGAGTLGGLAGGLLAAPVAATGGVTTMLVLLAIFQALAAYQVYALASSMPAPPRRRVPVPEKEMPSAWRVLADAPYLRSLAALILLGTTAVAFVDYVLKVQATTRFGSGAPLGTFFSLYYAGLNLATFAVQAFGSRFAIEKIGLAAAAGAPSFALTIGSILGIVTPGLWSVAAAHGGERVSRGALLRTGYEQFYTPLPPAERRAVKATVDVSVARAGDILGWVAVQIVIALVSRSPIVLLLSGAIACSVLALFVSRSLTRGYVSTLEKSLLHRAVEIDLSDIEDVTTRTTVLQTLRRPALTPAAAPALDSGVREVAALRSGNAEVIRRVLHDSKGLRPALVPHVIALLTWDPVAPDAIRALRGVAEERVGELIDALIDPNQPFAVRRRLARVFSVCVSQRAADGLMLGLDDLRFEVRFHCGRSLAAIVEKNARIRIDGDALLDFVRREVDVSRSVWEGRQLLDAAGRSDEPDSAAELVVSERASQSLAHVFTLLSLVLPTEPLRIAYSALQSSDQRVRGTALEYLDAVLPQNIKESLWPFLEIQRITRAPARPREEILADLLRANESVAINLKTLERQEDAPARPASTPRRSS